MKLKLKGKEEEAEKALTRRRNHKRRTNYHQPSTLT